MPLVMRTSDTRTMSGVMRAQEDRRREGVLELPDNGAPLALRRERAVRVVRAVDHDDVDVVVADESAQPVDLGAACW